jgi:hypothetical protein
VAHWRSQWHTESPGADDSGSPLFHPSLTRPIEGRGPENFWGVCAGASRSQGGAALTLGFIVKTPLALDSVCLRPRPLQFSLSGPRCTSPDVRCANPDVRPLVAAATLSYGGIACASRNEGRHNAITVMHLLQNNLHRRVLRRECSVRGIDLKKPHII